MTTRTSLVWFRHDLRVADNPALTAAVKRGSPILPVSIWEPTEEGAWSPGAASRWWLHQSFTSLDARLRKRGSCLVMRQGNSLSTLQSLIRDAGPHAVFWNHRSEPSIVERDTAITRTLRRRSGRRKFSCGFAFRATRRSQ